MRVLIYSDMNSSPWGGSEILWSKLISVLRKRHADIAVTCFARDQAKDACQENQVSKTMLLPRSAIHMPRILWVRLLNKLSFGYLQRFWWWFWRCKQRRFCERFSPDVVFISMSWPYAGRPLRPYLQNSNVPYACFLHYVAENLAEKSADDERRGFFENASKVLTTGQRSIKLLEQWLGKQLVNTIPMLNFVEMERFAFRNNGNRDSSERKRIRLLCVARLCVRDKGQEVLLESLAELPDINWHLTLAGDGPDRHFLEQQVQRFGIANKVDFLGRVSTSVVPDLLAGHDIFVLSSRNEGLPLSLLEAMASGLPCIATDVGSVKEVLIHEKTGLLVQPNNPIQLKEALEQMITDVELRKRCSIAARTLVKEKCNEDKFLTYIADLLEEAAYDGRVDGTLVV